jgi:hypothetical protein
MSSQTSPTSSATRGHRETSFIEPSGGLLTEQLIYKLRDESCSEDAVQPQTFAHPGESTPTTEAELEGRIGELWEDLQERWDEATRGYELYAMDVSEARTQWMLKLFEALGFEPAYQHSNLVAGEIEANLSHLGWEPRESVTADAEGPNATPPVLHTVRPDEDHPLDDGNHRGAEGRKQSPHDELQRYLNSNDDIQWSIVTDGLKLRLVRDYYHTYTRGYVEFDLENIFTERNYDDFRALYRLCHASRFTPPEDEDEDDPPIEQLYQVALSTGVKIGQDLQSNVISAIETLGTGLLTSEIREALREGGEEEAKEYYQEVLLIVYRLLFLLYAEQRGMMASRESLYTEEYAVTNLREKAETRRSTKDDNTDLWHGLQITFRLVEEGNDELDVPCYDGMLFDSERLEWIAESECPNDALLDAIEDLTLIEYGGTRQRISYADLGVEEIGSVYESLLEFTPRLATEVTELEDRTVSRGEFYLDDRGTERKETGSYYTDPGLVQELVRSALKPVVEDRLEDATTTAEKEDALLDISVCDPASGSGAFLIAANNFLAQRLARIRSESDYPPEDQIREARREVLQHCIYAVDLNPMAVELAKVSLWINSAVEDKPLNFLDHHIKCGNSLVGTNSELVEGEFPVDAYETSGGRDWHVGNEIRKRVRSENKERSKGSSESSLQQWGAGKEEYVDIAERLDEIEEEDTEDIEKKKQLYEELQQSEAYQQQKLAYDIWTAAFYWPMDGSAKEYPSPSTIEKVRRNSSPNDDALQDLIGRATKIAEQQRFFHWEIEFPEIYTGKEGFDCIIGNPPWERIELIEEEYFAVKKPKIANTPTKSEREELIDELKQTSPELYDEYEKDKQRIEQQTKFLQDSGRYPLTGRGNLNTYALFSELALEKINIIGRSGIVTPTGIATDSRTQHYFSKLVSDNHLVSLYDFENTNKIFPDVDNRFHFCLLTISGEGHPQNEFELSFSLSTIDQLNEVDRKFNLTPEELQLVNPNTNNLPTFRHGDDAELITKIYRGIGAFLIEDQEGGNPWEVESSGEFHMTHDDGVFQTKEELESDGWSLDGNLFKKDTDRYYPLYESKLIHQFNHRFATFEDLPTDRIEKGTAKKILVEELDDPSREVLPRYWVPGYEYREKHKQDWHLVLRTITNATNERTIIGSIIPKSGAANSLSVLQGLTPDESLALLGCLNSFVLDYVARQKIGGTNLNWYVLWQLPVPSPDMLSSFTIDGDSLLDRIVELSYKLQYTAHDLDNFASQTRFESGPFKYSGESTSRESLRFELEAIMCHVYGIESNDFERLFDSFEQIKNRDMNEYEYYRTREKIKAKYDEISSQISQ